MAFGNTNSILSSLIKNQNSNSSFKELKIWQGSEDEYNSSSIKPYYAWANNDNLIFTKNFRYYSRDRFL